MFKEIFKTKNKIPEYVVISHTKKLLSRPKGNPADGDALSNSEGKQYQNSYFYPFDNPAIFLL